jgi:hypothetical protein
MNPTIALSPAFDRARRLSRIMQVLFTIGFWLVCFALLVMPLLLLWPDSGKIDTGDGVISMAELTQWQQALAVVMVMAGVVPGIFLMHHARRIFGYFAKGEIFLAAPIVHMRQAGVWLVISFFAAIFSSIFLRVARILPPGQSHQDWWPLFMGITTFIAAHVMTEASRIAAENAEIV